MQRYIALLRAINVGGHNLKMEQLRALFAELGLSGVETFIASGNVIFEAPQDDASALAERVEAHLRAALGYEVTTFLRTPAELAAVARYEPFPGVAAPSDALYICFFAAPPAPEAEANLRALGGEDDEFHAHERDLYWLRRSKISDSQIPAAALARALGAPNTMRNATTVRKLAAKYPAG